MGRARMSEQPKNTPSFESALAELETLVQQLERGDLSLEQSLEFFERGVHLTRSCQQSLDAAEQRVKILLTADDSTPPESFNTNSV